LSAWLPASARAQFPADDGAREVDQITFSPQRSGSVLQATGNRLRCDLISMTADMVVVRSGQRTHEIEMEKVRSVRSTDGKFDYSPGDESFESLLRRCRRIQGVTIGKLQVFDDLEPVEAPPRNPDGQGVPDTPKPGEQGSPVAQVGGASTSTNQGGNPRTDTNNTTTPGSGAPDASADGDAASARCGNCLKAIPPTLQNGDRCPHCGVIFWDQRRPIASIGTTPAASSTGGNPGDGTHPMLTPSGGGAQYPAASGTAAPAGQAPVGGTPVTTVGGSSFSNMPLWMKVGLFVGMLAIAWLLIQRR
jgi:hypothetical protein